MLPCHAAFWRRRQGRSDAPDQQNHITAWHKNTGGGHRQARTGQEPAKQVPAQQTPFGILAQPPPGQHAKPTPPQRGLEASAPLRASISEQSTAKVTANSWAMSSRSFCSCLQDDLQSSVVLHGAEYTDATASKHTHVVMKIPSRRSQVRFHSITLSAQDDGAAAPAELERIFWPMHRMLRGNCLLQYYLKCQG